MVRTGSKEEGLSLDSTVGNTASLENKLPQTGPSQGKAEVDSIIDQWFTDLWLLSTGEEVSGASAPGLERDGRALAMICNGQMHLLGSPLSTLSVLRSVGIEMS
jgi:hypothetical protein